MDKDDAMRGAKANAGCPGHIVLAGPPIPALDFTNFAGECGFNTGFDAKGKPIVAYPRWFASFYEGSPAWLAVTTFNIIRFALNLVGHLLQALSDLIGCAGGAVDAALVKKALLGFFERWGGMDTSIPERIHTQILNATCPTELMSAAEANACYLADTIDYDTWKCHVKAEGYKEREQAPSVWSQRSRPGTLDLLNLFRRKEIDADAFRERMRGLGWLEDDEVEQFVKAQRAIPTLPDIVRMMVRDAADEDVAIAFQYDKDFDNKFTGILKTWAEANGVDFEIAKYYWRAHWEIPSPTQLYEILHRTNPDDPQVPAGLATLESEVKEALEVNDMAPGWVDRMTFISYRPITNTDGMRAYMIRSIDEDQFVWILRRNGYKYSDAATLVNYYRKARHIRDVGNAGGMSTRKIVRLYKDSKISRDEARKRMGDLDLDPEVQELALDGAILEARDETRGRYLAAIKRKFIHWIMDDAEADGALKGIGLDSEQSIRLINEWQWFRVRGERHLTAAQLCQLLGRNRISVPEYVTGLRRLNYTDTAISGMYALCTQKNSDALQKQIDKALKDSERKQKEYERKKAARCKKPTDPCGNPVPEPEPPPPPEEFECREPNVSTPDRPDLPATCVSMPDGTACCPPGELPPEG